MFKDFCETCGPAILTVSIVVFLFIVGTVYWHYKKKREPKALLPVTMVDVKRRKGDSADETECRRVVEEHFQQQFPKCRPDFLKNNVTSTDISTYNMELDCYNEELKLAVEPAAALGLAALQTGVYRPQPQETVGLVLCGANFDPASLG